MIIRLCTAWCAGFVLSAGLAALEIWRVRQIAFHDVDPLRLWILADVIYYGLYVPDHIIRLMGSKPFLDFSSHYVGYGNDFAALLMIVGVGSIVYGTGFLLLRAWVRYLFRRRRPAENAS